MEKDGIVGPPARAAFASALQHDGKNDVARYYTALADAQAFTVTNVADANRIRQVTSAFARAALFTNQIPAFAAAPSVYPQRLYLKSFAAATRNARKYVLLVTNTQDVIIFDLEDKIRDDLLNLSITNSP